MQVWTKLNGKSPFMPVFKDAWEKHVLAHTALGRGVSAEARLACERAGMETPSALQPTISMIWFRICGRS